MRSRLPRSLALLLVFSASCRTRTPTGPPPPPPPPPVHPVASARPIAAPGAFDLIAVADGAILAWGATAVDQGGVHVVHLDALGDVRGQERVATPPSPTHEVAVDVAVAAAGGRMGVAWVVPRPAHTYEALATYGSESAEQFAAPLSLGDTERPTVDRGMLSLAASDDGQIMLTHRLTRANCQASNDHNCARYRRTTLGAQGPTARPTDNHEVAHPCEPLLSGAVWVNGTWFDAVCGADAGDAVNVFAIRPSISYASASVTLRDCRSRGLAPLADGALAVGDCADGVGAFRLSLDGQVRESLSQARLVPKCQAGRLELGAEAQGARIALPLTGPTSNLHAFLPNEIAPRGARAVWTGQAILVASAQMQGASRHVVIRRYQCEGDALERTDNP